MEKRYISIKELSEYLGRPTATLYQLVYQRRIPFTKMGRSLAFDRREIDEWVKKRSFAGMNLLQKTA